MDLELSYPSFSVSMVCIMKDVGQRELQNASLEPSYGSFPLVPCRTMVLGAVHLRKDQL